MRRILVLSVLVLFACSATVAFADKKGEDMATLDALMVKVDIGEMTYDQALAKAIRDGVSFEAIVAVCQEHSVSLDHVITAAAEAGISSEVALAKMADAGVSKEALSAAMSQAAGQDGDGGLGYTASNERRHNKPVHPVTPNPGGHDEGRPVSPGT